MLCQFGGNPLRLVFIIFALATGVSCAQEKAGEAKPSAIKPNETKADTIKPEESLGEPANLTRMSKDDELWIDAKRKIVVIGGEVCLREGQLEMFACPKGTKEHESVVVVNCKPRFAHAALLAIGAKEGTPVKFDPEYKAATGMVVDIYVLWKDEKGEKHKVRAQEWVKHVKTEKPMPHDWVFAGSGFWKDEDGTERYYADGGEFICVSNFASATLDLPIASSGANSDLLFTAFTDKIPPRGTKVRLVLAPRFEEKK